MCVCALCVSLQFSDSLLCFIEEEDSEEGGEQDIMQVLGNMVMALLVKYWIYICGGMFFFVSFEGTIVMYKIIYMMMFLSCVALYQVSKHADGSTGHSFSVCPQLFSLFMDFSDENSHSLDLKTLSCRHASRQTKSSMCLVGTKKCQVWPLCHAVSFSLHKYHDAACQMSADVCC